MDLHCIGCVCGLRLIYIIMFAHLTEGMWCILGIFFPLPHSLGCVSWKDFRVLGEALWGAAPDAALMAK